MIMKDAKLTPKLSLMIGRSVRDHKFIIPVTLLGLVISITAFIYFKLQSKFGLEGAPPKSLQDRVSPSTTVRLADVVAPTGSPAVDLPSPSADLATPIEPDPYLEELGIRPYVVKVSAPTSVAVSIKI